MGSRVILVTDADCRAKEAVEAAARNVGGRCISLSGCRHPGDERLTPDDIAELVRTAEGDPVVVMVDDEGHVGEGFGEAVIRHLVAADGIDVVGAVAVASNTADVRPAAVLLSVTRDGVVTGGGVDKEGHPTRDGLVRGDTAELLGELGIRTVVGMGDPGKMAGADRATHGAPITTKALEQVLERAKQG